jgi:hypothetical protein
METAILAFGTIGFWIFSIAMIIAMLTCINFQKGAGATFTAILTILAFQFYGGIDIFGYIRHNPMSATYIAGAYAIAGVATGVFKWWRYVRNNLSKYQEAKAEYLDDNGGKAEGWGRYREQGNYSGTKFIFEPLARRHKAAITMWMTYWPLVLVWTVINDPVRKFFKAAYERLSGVLESISKNAFKDADSDMPAASRRKVGSLDDSE